MHNDIERTTLYGNQELKNIRESTTVLKAQYQTSLGLGKPFPRDSPRGQRRTRGSYNRFANGPGNYSRGRGRGYVCNYAQPASEVQYAQTQQTPCGGVTIATTIELEIVNVFAVVDSYTLTNK